MRRVALKATLWSTGALISISAWRATALLLSDISAEWTADAVDTYAGRIAHWTILAVITLGYLIHALRRKPKRVASVPRRSCTVHRVRHNGRAFRPWHERVAHASSKGESGHQMHGRDAPRSTDAF